MGQIAELAGDLLPIAFIAGAIFVAFSSYFYVQFSNAYKYSGGVAKFLTKAYGPGIALGSFSLLMYISMVVTKSLVAGTFGAYALRLFPEEHAGYASVLGIILIAVAYIVDIYGNRVIAATAALTVIIKVAGIALFAISGLVISSLPTITVNYIASDSQYLPESFNFIATLALSIIAYKGFTTITNHGGDIKNPHKNVGRSHIISITICTVIYVALALSVARGLSVEEIVVAKDYALAAAAAAKPVFGEWGYILTIFLTIITTVSGVIASIYSASRVLGMLSQMKPVPNLNRAKSLKTLDYFLRFLKLHY
ncbi:APC family permease [Flavobacterium sp. ALD4]|uniref:APC family permease n=1 Tax=Flavobacterium sp. ALD4 TaxID=2058314 RepID=UPI001E54C4B9|nr:APC family permease [Flavobacterium sp. ALD4]